MSLVGKLAASEEANKALNERVAELEAQVAEHGGVVEAMTAESKEIVDGLNAKVEELEAKAVQHGAELEEANGKLEASNKELETAKLTLESPAHKDASAEGEDEAADSTVVVDEPEAVERDFISEFQATEEGPKRAEWLAENAEGLQKQYNAVESDVEEK